MTRQEKTGKRDLYFSKWVRENLPDSSTGIVLTDLDFILYDYKRKKIALMEIKTRNSNLKYAQGEIFKNIHKWIKAGISDGWEYKGFYLIKFEKTNFEDGKCFINGKNVTEKELTEILSFKV